MMVFSVINPSRDEFDRAVYDVLQRSEYNHPKDNITNFIDKIKEIIEKKVSEMLQGIFLSKGSVHSISNNISTLFIIVGLLLIFTIIVIIIVKASKVFNKDAKIREILGEKIDERTTPDSLRQKADNFEKEGEFREAIRYDFIALLLLMHEKNLIYLDETKTNEEINNYLRKNEFSMISVFEYLMNIFNSSWYGHKICEENLYDSWTKYVNKLWSGVVTYENKSK
ncbi:hypothetical protein [Clostridium sp. JS66]|uniref:hypothetical protein n=1 Tax=Clostridium sp. JS66 TaxID=3064705 RepID=UPI00298D8AFB|nr:hypothetical protein [Clostridium sp. JS66]WPC44566.1 hypothetical protein Q6H37_14095 [Clostridium sp. JS66]